MSEQFRIDSTFRNSSTVHRNIAPVLSPTKLMNDLGKAFLTYPTLSRYQYRQIGWRHLNGNVNGAIQSLGITDNTETKLYILNFRSNHNIRMNTMTKLQIS